MTAKNKPKLNKTQIAKMKEMYLNYTSITDIAKVFKVARNTVNWHINSNAWLAERKLKENEVFSSFSDAKKVDFVKMTQSATAIMARSLDNLATRHEPPTINEATRAADILKTLDNILRLDDGKPTDIVKNTDKPMDAKELKKKLKADPFATFEEKDEEDEDQKLN